MAPPYPVIPGGPTADTAAPIWYGSTHNGAGWWTFRPTFGRAVITAGDGGTFTLYSSTYDHDQEKYVRNEWELLTEQTTVSMYLHDKPYWLYATNGFAVGPQEEYDSDWIQLHDNGVRQAYVHFGRREKSLRFTYSYSSGYTPAKLSDSGWRSEMATANSVTGATGQPIPTQGFSEDETIKAYLAGQYTTWNDNGELLHGYLFDAEHQVQGFALDLAWSPTARLMPWDPNRPVNYVDGSEEWESSTATYAGTASLEISGADPLRYRVGDLGNPTRNRLPGTFELRTGGPLAQLENDYDPDAGALIASWTAPANTSDPSWNQATNAFELSTRVWDVSSLVNGDEFTVKAVLNPAPDQTHPNPNPTAPDPDYGRFATILPVRVRFWHTIYPPRVRVKLYRPLMLPPPVTNFIYGGPAGSRRAFRRSDI